MHPPAVPGMDPIALARWMDSAGLESGPIGNAELIGGGTQNVMVRFTRGSREFVLRRGPIHLRHNTNESIRREMHLSAALQKTDVPHPHLIAECPDESVLAGAAFYLMEPVEGFNASIDLPALHASDPEVRHRMGLATVDALATVATVDHHSIGLTDFGHPAGFLKRQVPRWCRELESYTAFSGYTKCGLPIELLATWLNEHRPTRGPVGIMHGDFHLANVMFDPQGPDVAAIVDWEMCTIGDPLLDLGWLLATWPDPDEEHDVIGTALGRAGGLPAHEELVERYRERTGFDVSAINWYVVMACFKLGIILEGTYARSLAGLAPDDVGQQLHTAAIGLFDRARRVIDRHNYYSAKWG